MTAQRFTNGAFVFTRARGVEPRTPAELQPLLAKHGLDPEIAPDYAGDRATIGRAFTLAKAGLSKEGLLLRPIKRSAGEIVFGIVRETTDVIDQRLDHTFEATVTWTAEPDPSRVGGSHPVAHRVAEAYAQLRGKITAEDWAGAITAHLESLDAARVRAGVFWLPPQRVDPVRQLGRFLDDIGIDLILCELEPEVCTVVQGVAQENLDDQLARLQAEVAAFDGKQKPSTYARRLDEFQRLRERAALYRDALGVGVDRAEEVLAELECRVTAMFELRSTTVVHRDVPASGADTEPDRSPPPSTPRVVLCFAGAEFAWKSTTDDVALFVSDDPVAQSKIETLQRMGIAGCWQALGQAEVRIANSGPFDERVSIRVRVPEGRDLHDCARSLSAIGIEVRQQHESVQ